MLIIFALRLTIAGLVSQVYDANLVNYFVTEYSPTTMVSRRAMNGYEIPCGHGSHIYSVCYYILLFAKFGMLPGISLGSMAMMYNELLKTEKKLGFNTENSHYNKWRQ